MGQREPDIYGRQSYDDLCKLIYEHAAAVGCQVELFQSNHEGTLIDAIQASRAGFGGIVINPGAYAHYSYAIYDALRCAPVPAVEYPETAAILRRYENSDSILKGIIDLAFQEGDHFVLVDYKTDTVSSPDVLVDSYREQLMLYCGALQCITGMPVKECYLYSTHFQKSAASKILRDEK